MKSDQERIGPSLLGKVALVTGASRGIGRAFAQRFAAAGATVVVTARSLERPAPGQRQGTPVALAGTLQETVALIEKAGGRAIPIVCDLESPSERAALVRRTVEAMGRLDILANVAGFADYGSVEDMSDDVYAKTVEHYLTAPFVLSRAAIPIMKAQGAGWILNVGSVSAYPPIRPYHPLEIKSGSAVYAAVKAAVTRLSQGLAAELLESNIAVNVVSPSTAVETPGASFYIPQGYVSEPVEYIAAVALDLVHAPASERTGVVAYSMHYANHHRLQVASLDGRTLLPQALIPEWSHPDVNAAGL